MVCSLFDLESRMNPTLLLLTANYSNLIYMGDQIHSKLLKSYIYNLSFEEISSIEKSSPELNLKGDCLSDIENEIVYDIAAQQQEMK